jgi:FkbM family methyltransferase
LKNTKKNTIRFIRYFAKFGFRGIIFFLKTLLYGNKIVTFFHPKYIQPIHLRNNSSDIQTFDQIFLHEEYRIDINFVPEVIVDCGANIGLASAYFKNKFPDAKIISIEPEKSNYKILNDNIKNYNNIHCINSGIWYKPANLMITNVGSDNWGFIVEETGDINKNTIPAISIDEIIKQYNLQQIDILKIDIEGSEKELFESNFENWLPKTKIIIVELHDRIRKGASRSFFKALSKYKFSMIIRGENLICFIE